MQKAKRFCQHPGCSNLTEGKFCEEHRADELMSAKQRDIRRGTAQERGYTKRWSRYSKAFLARPENQFCVLHIDSQCAGIAQCVDHIDPPDGPDDPRFWDRSNHQPACIHCNSVKGHKKQRGSFIFGAGEPESEKREAPSANKRWF